MTRINTWEKQNLDNDPAASSMTDRSRAQSVCGLNLIFMIEDHEQAGSDRFSAQCTLVFVVGEKTRALCINQTFWNGSLEVYLSNNSRRAVPEPQLRVHFEVTQRPISLRKSVNPMKEKLPGVMKQTQPHVVNRMTSLAASIAITGEKMRREK